jgi:hypothetical protein
LWWQQVKDRTYEIMDNLAEGTDAAIIKMTKETQTRVTGLESTIKSMQESMQEFFQQHRGQPTVQPVNDQDPDEQAWMDDATSREARTEQVPPTVTSAHAVEQSVGMGNTVFKSYSWVSDQIEEALKSRAAHDLTYGILANTDTQLTPDLLLRRDIMDVSAVDEEESEHRKQVARWLEEEAVEAAAGRLVLQQEEQPALAGVAAPLAVTVVESNPEAVEHHTVAAPEPREGEEEPVLQEVVDPGQGEEQIQKAVAAMEAALPKEAASPQAVCIEEQHGLRAAVLECEQPQEQVVPLVAAQTTRALELSEELEEEAVHLIGGSVVCKGILSV